MISYEGDLIVIGASAGGVQALQGLLGQISKDVVAPIAIVMHLPSDSTVIPDMVFGKHVQKKVVEVVDKMPIEKDHIYFAPPGYHLLIEKSKSFALSTEEAVNHSCPSIDVFFESAAEAFQRHCLGVILTGANNDGANGLNAIKSFDGTTIVQDPKEAEASMMPRSAINKVGGPDFVGTLAEIAQFLNFKISEGKV